MNKQEALVKTAGKSRLRISLATYLQGVDQALAAIEKE